MAGTDQIVWNSTLASEFTDLLLQQKHNLLDQTTALRNEMRKLSLSRTKEDRVVLSLLEQLKHIETELSVLEEDTGALRSGIYRATELFETAERGIADSFRLHRMRDGSMRRAERNGYVSPQNSEATASAPHSIAAEDWLTDSVSNG